MIINIEWHCDLCDTTETTTVDNLATTLFNLLPAGWGQRASNDYKTRTLYCPTHLAALTGELAASPAAGRMSILDRYRVTKAKQQAKQQGS